MWKTCLRQVAFFSAARAPSAVEALLEPEDEVFAGEEALRFLLETLCGLHSPVVGETEVFGQFRKFADERHAMGDRIFAPGQRWLRFVIHEVKALRDQFVNGIGAHSYGSLLRRHLRNIEALSLLGSGHLARELLPWVAEGRQVQVFARNPDSLADLREKYPQVQVADYSADILGRALVVAAPLSDSLIVELIGRANQSAIPVFDLRGENHDIRRHVPQAVTLSDLFSELDHLRQQQLQRLSAMQGEIKERVRSELLKPEYRPLGWDDLCG